MSRNSRYALGLIALVILLTGCPSRTAGPPSVQQRSTDKPDLASRVRFIETYVNFRRSYKRLDYHVHYQNNGGGFVPGPSDWDIRLIAEVPSSEIESWIPANAAKKDRSPPQWLLDLPGTIERDAITEWFLVSGVEVGLDRTNSIVAYRNTTLGVL